MSPIVVHCDLISAFPNICFQASFFPTRFDLPHFKSCAVGIEGGGAVELDTG